jgi:hypothetical protein
VLGGLYELIAPHLTEKQRRLLAGVPVADQEPPRRSLIAEAGQQIAGLLGNPQAGRMTGDAGKVHPPAAELDDKQHLHPPQEDRVDREAGRRPRSRQPAGAGTTASSSGHAAAPGQCRGRVAPAGSRGRHPNAKAQQLAVDPLVAPPRIVAGKPHDQLLHLPGYRRPSAAGGRVGPAPGHQAPVPAQQRLGPHQEHRPSRPWKQTAQRSEQRTILGLQAGPWMLAALHRKLVA